MAQKYDVYNHERRHKQLLRKLEESIKEAKNGIVKLSNQVKKEDDVISLQNAKLLLAFDKATGLEQLSRGRRIRYIDVSIQFAVRVKKDYCSSFTLAS